MFEESTYKSKMSKTIDVFAKELNSLRTEALTLAC